MSEPEFGGASRARTDDLIVANDALSQLSYSPLEAADVPIGIAILAAFAMEDQPCLFIFYTNAARVVSHHVSRTTQACRPL